MNSANIIINEPYPIHIGSGILKGFNNEKELFNSFSDLVILVDSNTVDYCLPWLNMNIPQLASANIIKIESGEPNKNINTTIDIWKAFSENYVNRKSLLINLGGGVVSDIGGFAASTFKRGIPFINIPTTLLAMADASVGGKTGVDLFNFKNHVGTFASPNAVIIDTDFLSTLSMEQILNGYAEIIKHALIADKALWKKLKIMKLDSSINWEEIIIKNVRIKHKIIKNDPFEKGVRKLLNFGHTIGHAMESYSLSHGERKLTHGEAIIIGMICEVYISVVQNSLDVFYANEICSYLLLNFSKYRFPHKNISKIVEIMKQDKKNINNKISFTLLREVGEATIDNFVDISLIEKSLEYYLQYV